MPEGDTIYRIAEIMRRTLRDDPIVDARGRPGDAQPERLIGARVTGVSTRGKHLLVDSDAGLTLHTHLGITGTWHRYRPGEAWRLPAGEAVAVIETATAVAVCFGAPTVELIETRALPLHPVLSRLGPDLLDEGCDMEEAARRLAGHGGSVAEALIDQRVVAGIGNVLRCEVLFAEQLDPFTPAGGLAPGRASALLEAARELLRANVEGGHRVTMADASGARPHASSAGSRSRGRWVYRRAGRPCHRCGTPIRSREVGTLPRRLYWCPVCQSGASVSPSTATGQAP